MEILTICLTIILTAGMVGLVVGVKDR